MRSGAAGHVGVVEVVHFHRVAGRACPVPVVLFRYSPERPLVPPPAGRAVVNFRAQAKEWSRRYAGKEIRLEEGLMRPGEPLCCPSLARITFFRYSPSPECYVVYSTRLVGDRLAG